MRRFKLILLLILLAIQTNSAKADLFSDVTLSNTEISISATNGYLKNLVYPLSSGNTFIEEQIVEEGLIRAAEGYTIRCEYKGKEYLFGWFFGTYGNEEWRKNGLTLKAVSYGPLVMGESAPLKITSTLILPENEKWFKLKYIIENKGGEPVYNVKFYESIEPNANSGREETTIYDSSRNLIYSTNGEGLKKYFGVFSTDVADNHDIGVFFGRESVLNRIYKDALNNADSFTGDSSFALEKDIGVLAPGEVVELTIYFIVGDSLEEIQSIADNLSERPVIEPIPEVVLNAEEKFYISSKNSIKSINDDVGYMIEELVSDVQSIAFKAALDKIVKLDIEDDTLKEVMESFCTDMVDVLTHEEVFGTDLLDIQVILKRNIAIDDTQIIDIIENKHQEFRQSLITLSSDANLNEIAQDITLKKYVVEGVPYFVNNIKETYNEIEKAEDAGDTVSWVLTAGGIACGVVAVFYPPSAPYAVPAAVKMLTAGRIIQIFQISSNAGQALYVAFIFGDVYQEEVKIAKIYTRELDRVKSGLETSYLPRAKGEVVESYIPGWVVLGETANFGVKFRNTGETEVDARAVLKIENPDGQKVTYYSKEKALSPNKEKFLFIEVPFPYINDLFTKEGTYRAEIFAEYGILFYEEKTDSSGRLFIAERPAISIFKHARVVAGTASEVDVIITVRNNLGTVLRNINVIDTIPKSLAATVASVEFITPASEVIDSDPIVKWTFDLKPGEVVEIRYKINVEGISVGDDIELPPAVLMHIDPETGEEVEQRSAGVVASAMDASVAIKGVECPDEVLLNKIFEIKAEVENIGDKEAIDIGTVVSVSEGMSVVSGGSSVKLGNLSPGEKTDVSWLVKAEEAGEHVITIYLLSENAGEEFRTLSVRVGEDGTAQVPEFETVAIPVLTILALVYFRRM